MDLVSAAEVFVEGFAFGKSFFHPYLVRREGPLLLMRDAPRRSGPERRIEVIAPDVPVPDVLERLERLGLPRYTLCAISPRSGVDEALKAAYKGFGFRYRGIEPVMVANPADAPLTPCEAAIFRITTPEQAHRLAKAAGAKQVLEQHLSEDPPRVRQYVAQIGDELVGWVRTAQVRPNASYVANMFVRPDLRRRGIGRSLLSALLRDDCAHGVEHSVLVASHTGAMLYPHLGYHPVGTLHLFQSPRSLR